jgi:colanic acid biosynthesis glycosyl transferase WcaI
MNLTILTQYYPPEVGAPQNRLSNLAANFAAAGHEVTVLTAMPNYPVGKIQNGYGGLLKREWQGTVRVIRTFICPSKSAALIPRLLNYLSFVFSSAVFGSFVLKPTDYLLVESPPLFLGLAGIWLSRLKRARLIFNVSDLWPESAVRLGVVRRDSVACKLAQRVESLCYRRAWLVTGQSQSILDDIVSRFRGQRTFLLSNGADTETFHPNRRSARVRARLSKNGEFVVLYAGLHGLAQGLDQVLEAAEVLCSEGDYRFIFIGDGPEKKKLMSKAYQNRRDSVEFMDPVPANEVPALLASADALLVPLRMHIPGAVPSKLYEAMASERPTVLVASGEAADIVQRYEAGLVVEPGDVSSLIRAVRQIRSDPALARSLANNARLAAVQHFDRARIARSFISWLEGCARTPQRGCSPGTSITNAGALARRISPSSLDRDTTPIDAGMTSPAQETIGGRLPD